MDMPNASRMGNCRRRSLNGRGEEDEVTKAKRGMNAGFPACVPERILASMTRVLRAVIMSLVPL